MSTIDDTLAERGSRYGDFEGHAYLTQCIKGAMREADGWDDLDNDMVECLEMVAHKIGRIINGDPEYVDSWTDIIGYVRLVEKRLIADHAALDEKIKKFKDDAALAAYNDEQAKEPTIADPIKAYYEKQEAKEPTIKETVAEATDRAVCNAISGYADKVAKQQEHKLVGDALKTLEKAGIIKETRTHCDRFHVLFVGEESGEI